MFRFAHHTNSPSLSPSQQQQQQQRSPPTIQLGPSALSSSPSSSSSIIYQSSPLQSPPSTTTTMDLQTPHQIQHQQQLQHYNRLAAALDTCLAQMPTPYQHAARVRADVLLLLQQTPTLQPRIAQIAFNDCHRAMLLQLLGTIPMFFKGKQYNIPMSFVILEKYPFQGPICYVTPTPNMVIKPRHRHVDTRGRCYLPYLASWNGQTSSLVTLVNNLSSIFGQDPPVYERQPQPPPPPLQPQQQQQQPHSHPQLQHQQPPPPPVLLQQPQQQQQQPPSTTTLTQPASASASAASTSGAAATTTVLGQPSSLVAPLSSSTDEILTCKICFEHQIDCVILNCGHMMACYQCGAGLKTCPICRNDIHKVMRVYFA